jgi:hypothetical protein
MLLSFIGIAFAAHVELKDARSIALNAYYQKANNYFKNVSFSDLEIESHYVINQDGNSVIYAFNFKNYGFILVAAEDAIEPILGYTFESQYSVELQSENFKGLLWQYGEHIQYLRNNSITASPEISQKWNELVNFNAATFSPEKSGKDIEPLLTCTWNQDWPYNYYCPLDAQGPGGRVYVGCVATAMSQIMLYWRYPNQGTGSHSYYCAPYGTQSVNYGATTYDWNGMVDNSDSKINLPMALIGYHAAVSVDMNFSPNGSGAYSSDVPYALKTYFGYANGVSYKQRSFYQLATWKTMIQNHLNTYKPLYYSGQSPDGGHAWVLDGFHFGDDTYHMNFGWSGQDNGWYLITNAGGFTSQQGMVDNIIPGDAAYPYGCTPDFVVSNLVGSIEDGSGPQQNYVQTASCSWLIDPQTIYDSVSKISYSFVVLDTESDDIITIYDGETTSSPILGTYAGNPATMPPAVLSTGNKMLITLTTDGDATTGTGFRGEFFTYQPSWCSGLITLTETSGSFDDGSGDWYYKNQSNCMWKIQPAWASDITLTFTEFDTEAGTDVVKIYDASNNQLLATYSGAYTPGNMPAPITIPSGKLFMTFQTNGAINRPGWVAEWEIANTSVEEQVAGFDQLNVYPNPAENLLNISFHAVENQSLAVRMISATGTLVYAESANDFSGYYVNTLDLSNFSKGVYFLRLTNDNGTVNKKVVIK